MSLSLRNTLTHTAAAVAFWIGGSAGLAQDGALRVFVPVAPGVAPADVAVSDCTFAGTDLSGIGLIFDCVPSVLYALSVGEETRYGHVQLRRGLRIADFSPHPLYELVADAPTPQEAAEAYAALDDGLRPLALRDAEAETDQPPVAQDAGDPEPAPAPEPSAAVIEVATLLWPTGQGTLQLPDGRMVEIVGQDAGNFVGRVAVDDVAAPLTVVSSINEACRVTLDAPFGEAPVPVALPCTDHEIASPLAAEFTGVGCFNAAGRALTCLVPEGQTTVTIEAPGWQPVLVTLGEDVPRGALVPDIALAPAAVSGAACAAAEPQVRLTGYCDAEGCTAPTAGALALDPGDAIPGPFAAGWTGTELPDRVALRVEVEGADPVERVFALDATARGEVAAWLDAQTSARGYPLDVALESTQYRLGRQLRFYADAQCGTALEGRFVDLSNPGNRRPDLPQCSYFRVEDEGRVRSDCLPLTYAAETQRVSATLPPEACPASRVVVMVSEDSRLNGSAGQAITSALDTMTRDIRAGEGCTALDLAHSVGEDREVLYAAEDLHFAAATGAGDAPIRLDFVTPATDVLRDLEWVYRVWGEDLAGIVLVADGTDVKPANMIESPAAMAWKLNNVMTQVITFDPSRNCTDFEQTLLFEECIAGEADQFGAQLTQAVDRALDTIRGQQ